MAEYVLDSDEAVILQESGAHLMPSGTVDLILTNKNIIQIYENSGFFRNEKIVEKYPLLDLKILNGKPNVRVGKNRNNETQLELYFSSYERKYVMDGIFTESNWASAITKAYKQRVAEVERSENGDGKVSAILNNVKDKISNFNININKKEAPRKTCKCPRCGAELTGPKGTEIHCEYCNAIVKIK